METHHGKMHDAKKTCEKVNAVRYGVEATAGVMIARQPYIGGNGASPCE
jgi:hypothetical protein